MSAPKYRDGLEAQIDYMHKKATKKATKESAMGSFRHDRRWVDIDSIPTMPLRAFTGFEPLPPRLQRFEQIRKALWFGLRPSWMYEREPHYDCGYLRHAAMNVALAWRWATRRETADDIDFALSMEKGPYSRPDRLS